MRIGLRLRLLVPLVLLLAANAAITTWAARSAANDAEAAITRQLDAVAAVLTGPGGFPLTPAVLDKMKRLSGAEFVFTPEDKRRIGTLDPLPDATADTTEANGETYRVRRLVFPDDHPQNAGAVLAILSSESRRESAVRAAVLPPLLLGGAVAAAAVLLLLIGSQVATRIGRVRQQARAIAAGDLRPQPLPPGPADEVKDLAEAVNELAEKLADYQRQLQQTERLRVLGQFSGGLAHQLRNAAGGARLAVQLYLKENPAGDREPLEVALRQLTRMEANLAQFLSLGKPTAPSLVPLDLAELLSGAVRLHAPQCRHAGTGLNWMPPGPLPVQGDATGLGHLFGNLLGNATEAAGPGGTVEVTASVTGREIVVEVADTGPGPTAAVAERLFEPFNTGREQGIGLGLAVAKQAADAHAGTIDWRREGGRTVFRVRLPTKPAA